MESWHLDVEVDCSSLLAADQFPHLANLGWPQSTSLEMMCTGISLIKWKRKYVKKVSHHGLI